MELFLFHTMTVVIIMNKALFKYHKFIISLVC